MNGPPGQKEAPRSGDTLQGAKTSTSLSSVRKLAGFSGSVKPVLDGSALADPPTRPDGPISFSIGGIPAEKPLVKLLKSWVDKIDREKESVCWEIYPSGVEISTGKEPSNAPPVDCPRGQIGEFTDEAKRRLKQAFMTLHVPGFVLRSVTCTTHRIFTKEEYQAARKRFAERIKYLGWAAIARLEKQRRGARHSHLALWTPPEVTAEQIRDVWLDATGEGWDPHARKHAVLVRPLSQDEAGWVIYMAKHDAKETAAQMVSGEKHWTIWGADTFVKRIPETFTLSSGEHQLALRVLRNHQRALRRSDVLALQRKYEKAFRDTVVAGWALPVATKYFRTDTGSWLVFDEAGELIGEVQKKGVPVAEFELNAWRRLKRNKVPPMHRGDLLRLLPGAVLRRICVCIQSGIIFGVREGNPF